MTDEGQLLEERPNHRRTLVRMAIMYPALTAVFGAALLVSLVNLLQGRLGAILPLIVIGLFTIAAGVHGLGAVRDLRREPTRTRGEVRRTWSKGMILWFFRTHYVHVGRVFFEVAPLTAAELRVGDVVELEHWPHTKHVIAVRRLEARRAEPQPPRPAVRDYRR